MQMNQNQQGFQQTQNNNQNANQNNPSNDIAQLQNDLKQLQLQNAQLRGTLQTLQKGIQNPQQPPQAQANEDFSQKFEPAVAQALQGMVNQQVKQIIEPINHQLMQSQNALGAVWDRLDETSFQHRYSGEKFEKFIPKVDEIRQQQLAEGKFITREQALQMVYFDETAKKVQPQKPDPVTQPEWNATLNMFVHPGTTDPWQPGEPVRQAPQNPQQQAAPQNPQMPDQQTQQFPGQQQQFPQQFQQQTGAQPNQQTQQQPPQNPGFFDINPGQGGEPQQNNLQNFQQPMQNMNQGVPQMPNATPTPAGQFQAPSQAEPDFMSMDANQLASWEQKYGDVPL